MYLYFLIFSLGWFLFLLLELLHSEVWVADDFYVCCVDLHCIYI